MTIVFGFCFPEQTIIAADTRGRDGNTGDAHDDIEKVFKADTRVLSGAGEAHLMASVAMWLDMRKPQFDGITESIRQSMEMGGVDPNEDAVRFTQWLISNVSGEGGEAEAQLYSFSAQNNYELQGVAKNTVQVIYPYGVTDEQKDTVDQMLSAAMNASIVPAVGADRAEACIQAVDAVIKYLSPLNEHISDRYTIGVHHITEGAKLSDVATDPAHVEFFDIDCM